MKKAFFILSTFLFLGLAIDIQAQKKLIQTAYTELEIDRRQGEDYKALPVNSHGMLCFLEGEQHQSGGNKELKLYYYNQELIPQWEKVYLVDYQDEIISEYVDGQMVYFLVSGQSNQYKVMRVDVKDGSMMVINLSTIKNFTISHFKAYKGNIITAGEVNNHPLAVFQTFEESMKPVVFPSISQLEAELVDVVIDSVHENIYVLLERLKPATEQGVYINRYDWDATLLDNQEIVFSNEYNIHSFLVLPSERIGEVMLFGSYGLGSDTGTQGIYSMTISEGKLKANRFYDFGYLNNFFNYLPEKKREKRIKKIKEKLKSDNKMRYRYKLFLHRLQVDEDRIIFVAESYTASSDYRNANLMDPSNYYWNRYRRMYSSALWSPYNYLWYYSAQNRRREMMNNTTDYNYQHAFALGFNKNGELLWDNSFTFQDDTESDVPMEKSQVLIEKDTVVMIQVGEEEVYYKASYQSNYQEELDTLTIPMVEEGDKYYDGEHGGTKQWFGPHFISSGVRELKNRKDGQRSRKVFFLARYSYIWHENKEEEKVEE